ncbi:hypothetical protein AB8O38_04655 [Saccharomonospora xinjiangensis]|uniref:hypothetical protein n=1 Tax=Saccharomonospora xinjiangensis TaxID=75294 RepID=UPI00350F8411
MVGDIPVRNPDSTSSRSSVRALRGSAFVAVLAATVLLAGQGTAAAVQAEPNAMTFGLLGPVGLVAVALGVVGMAAGALRQRRKNRLAAAEEAASATPVDASQDVTPVPAPVAAQVAAE